MLTYGASGRRHGISWEGEAMAKARSQEVVRGSNLEKALSLGIGAGPWSSRRIPEAGIPSLRFSDGPCGLRLEGDKAPGAVGAKPPVAYPTPSLLASTWDPALARRMGEALGEEARAWGVDVVLGPGTNLVRSPLGGRTFECLSEDPLLAGTMASSFVAGVQLTGTSACLKHLAANSQETRRTSYDARIDERTLHELYLRPFEMAVRRAHPDCVMAAYNRLNGTYCSDSVALLYDTLRRDWGFEGVVVSDWGGTHDRAEAYRAGCDLSLPGPSPRLSAQARQAVESGRLDVGYVRASAARVAALACSHMGSHAAEKTPAPCPDPHATALQVALEGQVLLKNDGLLPLDAGMKVALVGPFAAHPRLQGQGSSRVDAPGAPSLADLAPGWRHARGCNANGIAAKAQLEQAAKAAAEADACVVVVGTLEGEEAEGADRKGLALAPGFDELVRTVAAANPRTCVVVQSGAPVALPWEDEVAAVLWAGLGGEASSQATLELLMGAQSPSGRLAVSWPAADEDIPCAASWAPEGDEVRYEEGLLVGYRSFSTTGTPVLHPFGHGLTYTSFSYADIEADEDGVSFHLLNEGDRAGTEVSQAYLVPPEDGPFRPRLELAGFARTTLEAHELRKVVIRFDEHAFDVWQGGWRRQAGEYRVVVGRSAEDAALVAVVAVGGERLEAVPAQTARPEQPSRPAEQGPGAASQNAAQTPAFDETSSLTDMARRSRLARLVRSVVLKGALRNVGGASDPRAVLPIAASVDAAVFVLENTSAGRLPGWLARMCVRSANRGTRRR